MPLRPVRIFPVLMALFSLSCLEPTQVTFRISSDLPCDSISGTSITVGIEGQTEKGTPVQVTQSCTSDGTAAFIGTYTVIPGGGLDVTASIKVVAAVTSGIDVENDCTAANGYVGCIVVRRRLAFLAHRSLVVPIELFRACKDQKCGEDTSCGKMGTCESADVDTSTCENNTCAEVISVTSSGGGRATGGGSASGGGTADAGRDAGASDGGPVDAGDGYAPWARQAYAKASNTASMAQFGTSVSFSDDGNTMAVGAPGEASAATSINGNQADTSAPGAGAVYIFQRSGGTWVQQAYLKASNAEAGDDFGISVSLSSDGNALAVGADMEDSDADAVGGNQLDNTRLSAGAVYLFSRSGTTWTQQNYIKDTHSNTGVFFGNAVGLSGDGTRLVCGCVGRTEIYIYESVGGVWVNVNEYRGITGISVPQFGFSVAMSRDGTTIASGAPYENSASSGIDGDATNMNATQSGAVFTFRRTVLDGGVPFWNHESYVKASNPDAQDNFGRSVALSADGTTLSVGAWWEGSNATGINGNQTDNSAMNRGAVYVFHHDGSAWSQQSYLKPSNLITGSAGFSFGNSTSLSNDGNTLLVGASTESSSGVGLNGNQQGPFVGNSGAAYVFYRQGSTWLQHDYVKAAVPHVGDMFGFAVALAGDGHSFAVTSLDASNATGLNGSETNVNAAQAGAVSVFAQ